MAQITVPQQKAQPHTRGRDLKSLGVGYDNTPKALPIVLDFTGGSGTAVQNIDLKAAGLPIIQTVFINNKDNNQSVILQFGGSNITILCPAYCQGFFPVLTTQDVLNLTATSAGVVAVPIIFMNTQETIMVWSSQAAGSITGTVTVVGTVIAAPQAGVYVDRSGAVALGGTSQNLCAANGNRKRLFVQNPPSATESLFINFTAAASSAGGTSSIELVAGASFDSGQGPISTELVTITAATTAHAFTAKEM